MERYDIAIIGTGPAGLSAAITATIRNKKIILFGSRDLSNKLAKAHTIKNYLGLPEISGADLGKAFTDHLKAMNIEITEERVNAIYSMGDYYTLQMATEDNKMYEASSVILATGVVAGKPFPGEEELLGQGVSYCATCDAMLYRGKSTLVIGYSPKEEAEAEFLSEVVDQVYYIPMYADELHLPKKVQVIREKPLEILADGMKKVVKTDQNSYTVDGVFILRDAVSPGQLVPGLETEGSHVKVDRSMSASLPGCFACGDIVGAPYQYIKAAGEGNIAALSAVSYLDQLKRQQA
ncbi:MAG: NAD(P)/FAD-dependent oxidoreductase [Lachnospiraceae bacterium]|nr:NAD(P)/FAD-dependent oxidoreductase [Lachnospiraceae bacterium]